MTPEQTAVVLKRQVILLGVVTSVTGLAANYVIRKQDKELDKLRKAFRAMHDVVTLFEGHVPPYILAEGNELLAFARIEIKYDE